jgi:hypothetical protein
MTTCTCSGGLIFRAQEHAEAFFEHELETLAVDELLTRCSPCTCEAGQKWRELFAAEQAEWMEAL